MSIVNCQSDDGPDVCCPVDKLPFNLRTRARFGLRGSY
jgi:hypothetical protein